MTSTLGLHAKRHPSVAIAVCTLAMAGWLARPVSAQILYGSIVGTVTDQSGAAVPNANAKITSRATGLTRDTKTNALGLYRFLDLPAGAYDVEITASGFRPYTQTGVGITINSVNRVDVQM